MWKPRNATRITRPAMWVLGALLLADGKPVKSYILARLLFKRATSPAVIYCHILNLRRFGCEISSSPNGVGYRLLRVPPDEHLESLLAVLPDVKRSEWWATQSTYQRQRTA